MRLGVFARWIGREALRTPLSWAAALGVLLLGPALALTSPLSILEGRLLQGGYLTSIWFFSTYLGVLIGFSLLAAAGNLWDEWGAWNQTIVGGGLLFLTAIFYGALSTLPLGAMGPLSELRVLPALLCAGHWAGLACFVQRTGLQLGIRCIAVSCLGWWLPALLGGASWWERLRWVLAPARHLEVPLHASETSLGVLVDTIPLIAWWVAAALLPTRSAFKR